MSEEKNISSPAGSSADKRGQNSDPDCSEQETAAIIVQIISNRIKFCMSPDQLLPQWPDELDALTADPQHHTLLFENEFVRVLDTNIHPGEITNVHIHQFPASLYILSWSDFIRYDTGGNVLVDSRKFPSVPAPGTALWSGPLAAHALKNIGTTDLHVISVEVKKTIKLNQ